MGWAALAVKTGGRKWWPDGGHPPPQAAPSLWAAGTRVPAPWGQARCCHCMASPARFPGWSVPCSPSTEPVRGQLCICVSIGKILLLSLFCETTPCCHLSPAAEEKPSSASLCGEPQPPLITSPCTAGTEFEAILVKHRQGPPPWQPRTLGMAPLQFRHSRHSAGTVTPRALRSHL